MGDILARIKSSPLILMTCVIPLVKGERIHHYPLKIRQLITFLDQEGAVATLMVTQIIGPRVLYKHLFQMGENDRF